MEQEHQLHPTGFGEAQAAVELGGSSGAQGEPHEVRAKAVEVREERRSAGPQLHRVEVHAQGERE